jgi:hypothetical protein
MTVIVIDDDRIVRSGTAGSSGCPFNQNCRWSSVVELMIAGMLVGAKVTGMALGAMSVGTGATAV